MNARATNPTPRSMPMPRRSANAARRAYTLLELSIVVTIVALLSISAIPALSSVNAARQAAGAQHVERLLLTARAQALASGRPWGVEIDWSGQRVRLVYIPTRGAAPTPAPATGLQANDWTVLPTAYPGSALNGVTYCDGTGNQSGVIWFDADAVPGVRDASGARSGTPTTDAELDFAGGLAVHVREVTGAIERS